MRHCATAASAVTAAAAADGAAGGRSTCLIRCVALWLQMLETLKTPGAAPLAVQLNLKVYSFPVNAMPQLCEDGTHVCQAMLKVLRRLLGMVPTIGGMLGKFVLYYLCCDIFPVIMKATALDNLPNFFAQGTDQRRLAVYCLEFFVQLAAQFRLQLVINSSRGLKLLEQLFGAVLSKDPVAPGDAGYFFRLVVWDASSGAAVVVRGYGTKHPCWWWPLWLVLAFYRAQVATWATANLVHRARALLCAGTTAPSSAARGSARPLRAGATPGRAAPCFRANLGWLPACMPRGVQQLTAREL